MASGRSEYKHFQVRGGEGDPIFFTTICLDFVHAFASPEIHLRQPSLAHPFSLKNCKGCIVRSWQATVVALQGVWRDELLHGTPYIGEVL